MNSERKMEEEEIGRLKWFVFLLAGAIFLVTACGGGGSSSDGNTNPQNMTPTPTPTPGALTDILTDEEEAQLSAQELQEANMLSGSQLNTLGKELLEDENILKSKVYFKLAAEYYANQTSNDADAARFFYSLTRVLALPYDSGSDLPTRAAAVGYGGDLLDFGDLLDAFGYPTDPINGIDPRAPENLDVDLCPLPLPDNSPSGAELQKFLDDVVITEIEGALDSLEGVSDTFNTAWTDPYSGVTAESDYGDVLAARAALKGTMALIRILNAQNLDVDIDVEVNRPENTVEEYLGRNPEFFTPIAQSVLMQSAKTSLLAAADDAIDAINFMAAETDAQTDDWVSLSDWTADGIKGAIDTITDARKALRDGTNYTIVSDNPDYQSSVIDPAKFFATNPGLDFRSFLPAFDGDKPAGLLADPTFGGVLVSYEGSNPSTLNDDIDGRGTPDFLEDCPEIEDVWWEGSIISIEWGGDDDNYFCVLRDDVPIALSSYDSDTDYDLDDLSIDHRRVFCNFYSFYSGSDLAPGETYFFRIVAMPYYWVSETQIQQVNELLFSNEISATVPGAR